MTCASSFACAAAVLKQLENYDLSSTQGILNSFKTVEWVRAIPISIDGSTHRHVMTGRPPEMYTSNQAWASLAPSACIPRGPVAAPVSPITHSRCLTGVHGVQVQMEHPGGPTSAWASTFIMHTDYVRDTVEAALPALQLLPPDVRMATLRVAEDAIKAIASLSPTLLQATIFGVKDVDVLRESSLLLPNMDPIMLSFWQPGWGCMPD